MTLAATLYTQCTKMCACFPTNSVIVHSQVDKIRIDNRYVEPNTATTIQGAEFPWQVHAVIFPWSVACVCLRACILPACGNGMWVGGWWWCGGW